MDQGIFDDLNRLVRRFQAKGPQGLIMDDLVCPRLHGRWTKEYLNDSRHFTAVFWEGFPKDNLVSTEKSRSSISLWGIVL